MTNSERLQQIESQIHSTKKLLWNASQMRRGGSVFRLQDELDRLVDEKYRLIKAGA